MEHTYSKGLKFVSIMLVLAMLMTTTTFTVLAEEVAETVEAITDEVAENGEQNLPDSIAESSEEIADDDGSASAELFNSAETASSTSDSDSQYDTAINSIIQPFCVAIDERESISLNTGAVNYTEAICSLPGINGKEFVLNLLYNSAESTFEKYDYVYDFTIGLLFGKIFPIPKADTKEETYGELRYNLGAGWSFGIPSINTDSHNQSLILPGIGVYGLDLSENSFTDYPRTDMILSGNHSYNNGQYTSSKKLTFADGTVYYFNEDGLLLAMLDRHGTTVTFKYIKSGMGYYPSEIIDADGRSTVIAYADTESGKTVTVTLPDGSSTILKASAADSALYGNDNYTLSEITLADGERIAFHYSVKEGIYDYNNVAILDPGTLHYALLECVSYSTGAEINYQYEGVRIAPSAFTKLDIYRVAQRYMTEPSSFGNRFNQMVYTYIGNYGDQTSYSANVTRSASNGQVTRTCYTFNEDHLCTMQETKVGDTLKGEIRTTYDTRRLPKKVVQTTYGSNTLSTTELYTYDSKGNLTTYFSPKAGGNSKKTDYRTTHTYNSTYNLPQIVEYKQDSATTVKAVNTLTADKKNIAETATYVNGTLAALTTYTYNARGQMTSKTECLDLATKTGVTTAYTYDGANLTSETVSGMTDADGNTLDDLTTAYTYDIMGRLLTATDGGGNTTVNTYDVRGRLLTTTAPDGSVTTYEYDLSANDTTVLRTGREDLIVDFDSIGQKQSVYYASGDLQKEYFYDNQGRVVAEATGRGSDAANTVYYAYDAFDRVKEKLICDKIGAVVYRETYDYDDAYTSELSLFTKTVHGESGAPNAVTKTYTNKCGEVAKTDVGGTVTEYAYDYVGNPLRAYYTQGNTTVNVGTYTYDFRGNVLTETNALGDSRTIAYDAIGRKISESDFKDNTTTYTYDNAGRLLTVSSPLDGDRHSVVKYTYDGAGNITKQMQSAEAPDADTPTWRTVEYTYDDMNRVTDIAQTVDDAHKVWTHYAYNSAGDLTDLYTGLASKWSAAVNPDSYSRTHYVYNNRGKATNLTDALGQDETYVYDALGYVTEVTQRDGIVTRFTYNGLGKPLTEEIYADAEAEAPISEKVYAYYANGLTRSVTVDGNAVLYTYDALGNVLTETEETPVKAYTYDSRGRKIGYTLTVDGEEISTATYVYDEADRLISVTEGGLTTEYAYDENGNRASQSTGAVSVAYTYNDANFVTSLTNTMTNADGEEVVISAFAYTYYADGNQYTKSETMLGGDAVLTTYVYDGLGRLISETKGEDAIAYTYDTNGNRVGMTADGVVTTYTYDANNRLLTETVGETTTSYTYDANGNTLTAEMSHNFENGICSLCGDLQTYRLGDIDLDDEYTLKDVLGILRLCETTEEPEPEETETTEEPEPEEGEALLYDLRSASQTAPLTDTEDLNGNGVMDTDDYMLFLYDLLGVDFSAPILLMADETTAEQSSGLTSYADLDGNGTVDTDDYAIALSAVSEENIVLSDKMARLIADVNGDGIVTQDDANEVLHYVLNNDDGSSYPIGSIMTNTTSCTLVKTYAYNERGQQTGFANAANTAAYSYNPNGLRNVKTVGGSTKYFVYNGMNIVYEYSESVADAVTYFYGLNRTHNSNGEIYVYNAHGDVVQLVKDNAVEVSYTYDAFGNLTAQIGESDNPFLYCGEYYDAESQTYYLRARYYDPANGRFTQQDAWAYMDTSDPLSLNLYTYCCNNPVMYVDSSGHVGVLASIIGVALLLATTLTSCNSSTISSDDTNQDAVLDEFLDPESPLFIGGYATFEEAFNAALYETYMVAFDENSNWEEHMTFIYSVEIEIEGDGTITRYAYVNPYSDSRFPGDIDNVIERPEYTHGYHILASIHTHPWHNENIIYTGGDHRDYDSYVVDIDGYLYCLSPGQKAYDYTSYGKIDFSELAKRVK